MPQPQLELYQPQVKFFNKNFRINKLFEISTVEWRSMSATDPVPRSSLYAGDEADGTHTYVGRCHYEGGTYPAKIIPNKQAFYCK